jgi:hypothetical protein
MKLFCDRVALRYLGCQRIDAPWRKHADHPECFFEDPLLAFASSRSCAATRFAPLPFMQACTKRETRRIPLCKGTGFLAVNAGFLRRYRRHGRCTPKLHGSETLRVPERSTRGISPQRGACTSRSRRCSGVGARGESVACRRALFRTREERSDLGNLRLDLLRSGERTRTRMDAPSGSALADRLNE